MIQADLLLFFLNVCACILIGFALLTALYKVNHSNSSVQTSSGPERTPQNPSEWRVVAVLQDRLDHVMSKVVTTQVDGLTGATEPPTDPPTGAAAERRTPRHRFGRWSPVSPG